MARYLGGAGGVTIFTQVQPRGIQSQSDPAFVPYTQAVRVLHNDPLGAYGCQCIDQKASNQGVAAQKSANNLVQQPIQCRQLVTILKCVCTSRLDVRKCPLLCQGPVELTAYLYASPLSNMSLRFEAGMAAEALAEACCNGRYVSRSMPSTCHPGIVQCRTSISLLQGRSEGGMISNSSVRTCVHKGTCHPPSSCVVPKS